MRRVFLLSEPANPSQSAATSFQQLGLCANEWHVGGHDVGARLLGIPHPVAPQSLSAIIFLDSAGDIPHWWHTELNQSNLLFPYLDALFPAGDLHCRITAGAYATPGNMDALTLVPASQRESFINSFEADPFALWDLTVCHIADEFGESTIGNLLLTNLVDDLGLLFVTSCPISKARSVLLDLCNHLGTLKLRELTFDDDIMINLSTLTRERESLGD
jgi:hypothetical protein